MNIIISVDNVKKSPHVYGELFRDLFFNQSKYSKGCYDTFELREKTIECPDLVVGGERWNVLKKKMGSDFVMECRWFWDGDGTLMFKLPDGDWLFNDDCKKEYCWTVIPGDIVDEEFTNNGMPPDLSSLRTL